jgi:hypothetical protein
VIQLLSNRKTKAFTKQVANVEKARGRFLDCKPSSAQSKTSSTAPWVLSPAQQREFDERFSQFPLPDQRASRLKRPFSSDSAMKANDHCHLLSELGVFALGNLLPFHPARVIRRLCLTLHELIHTTLTLRRLALLEAELIEALAEWELRFPFCACTINFHLLLHFPIQLFRVGPAPCFWMYGYERETGRLVDGIHSMKNPEHSIVSEYLIRELMEQRRVSHPHFQNLLYRRDLHWDGANVGLRPMFSADELVVALLGSRSSGTVLAAKAQKELLHWWRRLDSTLDSLFRRYEADVSSGRYSGSIAAWTPQDGGRALTATERQARSAPNLDFDLYFRAHVNHAYFRGVDAESKFERKNSVIKIQHHTRGILYAQVHRFIVHRAYRHEKAPVTVFIRVIRRGWFAPAGRHPDTNLQLVKRLLTADSPGRFAPLSDCFAFNVALTPSTTPGLWVVIEFDR